MISTGALNDTRCPLRTVGNVRLNSPCGGPTGGVGGSGGGLPPDGGGTVAPPRAAAASAVPMTDPSPLAVSQPIVAGKPSPIDPVTTSVKHAFSLLYIRGQGSP